MSKKKSRQKFRGGKKKKHTELIKISVENIIEKEKTEFPMK